MATNKDIIFNSSGLINLKNANGNLGSRVKSIVGKNLEYLTNETRMDSAKRKISNLIHKTRSTPVREKGDIPLKHLITNIELKNSLQSSAKKQQTTTSHKDLRASQYSGKKSNSIPRQEALNNTIRHQPYISILGNNIANAAPQQVVQQPLHYQQKVVTRPPIPQNIAPKVVQNPATRQRKYSLTRHSRTNSIGAVNKIYAGNYPNISQANFTQSPATKTLPKAYNSQRIIPSSGSSLLKTQASSIQRGLRSSGYNRVYQNQNKGHFQHLNPVTITGDTYYYGQQNSSKIGYGKNNTRRRSSGSFVEGKNLLTSSNYDRRINNQVSRNVKNFAGNNNENYFFNDHAKRKNFSSFQGLARISQQIEKSKPRSRSKEKKVDEEDNIFKMNWEDIKKRNGFQSEEAKFGGKKNKLEKENLSDNLKIKEEKVEIEKKEFRKQSREKNQRFKSRDKDIGKYGGKIKEFDVEKAIDRILRKAFT